MMMVSRVAYVMLLSVVMMHLFFDLFFVVHEHHVVSSIAISIIFALTSTAARSILIGLMMVMNPLNKQSFIIHTITSSRKLRRLLACWVVLSTLILLLAASLVDDWHILQIVNVRALNDKHS